MRKMFMVGGFAVAVSALVVWGSNTLSNAQVPSKLKLGVTKELKKCQCCKNLETRFSLTEKRPTSGPRVPGAWHARNPYFEALKIMGESGPPYVASIVGKTCSAEDRLHPDYKALKDRLPKMDAKIVEIEKIHGYTLDRDNPLWENDKGIWCCNWTNKDGQKVQK